MDKDQHTYVPDNDELSWDRNARQYVVSLSSRFKFIHSEVCLGVDWMKNNAVFFQDISGRNYPKLPGWMFGTADLICVSDTEILVADWKTGGNSGAEEQLLSLLAATVRAFESLGDRVPPKLSISCLSVRENGVWVDEREVSRDEIDAHWQAMSWRWDEILSGKETVPVPGIHCTQLYCPHLAYCSAIADVTLDFSEMDQKLIEAGALVRKHRLTDKPSSDEEASYTMERITAANRQIKYLTECMKEYTKNGGKIVVNGYEWSSGSDGFRWRKSK